VNLKIIEELEITIKSWKKKTNTESLIYDLTQ